MAAVISDAGNCVLLSCKDSRIALATSTTFWRTGLRRTSPEYLAVDPKDRVLMLGAIEKTRLIYILFEGPDGIQISSPVECNCPNTITYDLVSLDVGYKNPVFVTLESSVPGELMLVFYEFDLGLNYLQTRQSIRCPGALFLLPLPEKYRGLLLFGDGYIDYFTPVSTRSVLRLPIDECVVNAVVHEFQDKLFALVQIANGDVFKLTFELSESETISQIRIHPFAQATSGRSMHIFKQGFLFIAAESGNHQLYQFNKLGDDDIVLGRSYDESEKPAPVSQLGSEQADGENIEMVDEILNLSPMTCLRVDKQSSIAIGTGKSKSSEYKYLEYGIEPDELVSTNLLSDPVGLFCMEFQGSSYIVISFQEETVVLEVDENLKKTESSPLRLDTPTLGAYRMKDALVQVTHNQIRVVVGLKVSIHKTPTQISNCSANSKQLLIFLEDNSVIYYEMDEDNVLLQMKTSSKFGERISCIGVGLVPEGRVRSLFAIIGFQDNTLRVLSLDLDAVLEIVSVQSLSGVACSVLIDDDLSVHIGLTNGVYINGHLDISSGSFDDPRTRFLGPAPVNVFPSWVSDDERRCVLITCTKSWLCLSGKSSAFDMAPLSYPALSIAARLSIPDSPKSIVGAVGRSLRMLNIENVKDYWHASAVVLPNTPKYVNQHGTQMYVATVNTIQVFNSKRVVGEHTIDGRVLASRVCRFDSRKVDYLVVSVTHGQYEDFRFIDRSPELRVYEMRDKDLILIHSTAVEFAVHSLSAFKGFLLAGVGGGLYLYDIGSKHLLKKGFQEFNGFSRIVSILTSRNRIFVGDVRRSVAMCAWSAKLGFVPVADDVVPRAVSAMTMVDLDTVAAGDRMGNLFILRCPEVASRLTGDDSQLALLAAKPENLGGFFYKFQVCGHYFVNDILIGLRKASLVSGGQDILLYGGIQGTLGSLIPITLKADVKFFRKLETLMRQKCKSVLGRDHLSFRGSYSPPKNVIDGDLCEEYIYLDAEHRQWISAELDMEPKDVERIISEFRARSVY